MEGSSSRSWGSPEWAEHRALREPPRARRQLRRAAGPVLQEWCRKQSVQELYDAAQRRRVPFAPVSTMGDLLASPHLNGARLLRDRSTIPSPARVTMPGAPYRIARDAVDAAPRRHRCSAQHTAEVPAAESRARGRARMKNAPRSPASASPTSRWVWAGPFCTLQLAHLGAEVIRVETSRRASCVTRHAAALRGFPAGPEPQRLLQPVQPGQEER